jgi:spore cortex formation protein SpoVR/YcgB (stage V sporulation)
MIVSDIQIHIVLNRISVGRDFLIDAHINREDVNKVRKCMYHNSIPNIRPGIMIIALAIHADNSITL